ncbi:putative RNA-directed DNA polymerase [Senna tora]|uniref:Putative RNA-directed DNA polymerase n=1 Tax=Senna tora TaxID=362788 RepID=A0A834VY06_9FABA|nr:putative RNA-directed DNA polymerase [Senna tora]
MVNMASRLGDLNSAVTDSFLVNHALNSLPSKFDSLKTLYVAQQEVWDFNTMISICAQEEERMKLSIEGSVNLVSQSHQKKKGYKNDKNKGNGNFERKMEKKPGQTHNALKPTIKKTVTCWHCKKKGHRKADCFFYKNSLKKSNNEGYRFYCSTRGSKIVEAMSAKFLEDDIVESDFSHGASITLEDEQEITREVRNVIIPIPLRRERAEPQVDETIQNEQVHDNVVENPTGDETEILVEEEQPIAPPPPPVRRSDREKDEVVAVRTSNFVKERENMQKSNFLPCKICGKSLTPEYWGYKLSAMAIALMDEDEKPNPNVFLLYYYFYYYRFEFS